MTAGRPIRGRRGNLARVLLVLVLLLLLIVVLMLVLLMLVLLLMVLLLVLMLVLIMMKSWVLLTSGRCSRGNCGRLAVLLVLGENVLRRLVLVLLGASDRRRRHVRVVLSRLGVVVMGVRVVAVMRVMVVVVVSDRNH